MSEPQHLALSGGGSTRPRSRGHLLWQRREYRRLLPHRPASRWRQARRHQGHVCRRRPRSERSTAGSSRSQGPEGRDRGACQGGQNAKTAAYKRRKGVCGEGDGPDDGGTADVRSSHQSAVAATADARSATSASCRSSTIGDSRRRDRSRPVHALATRNRLASDADGRRGATGPRPLRASPRTKTPRGAGRTMRQHRVRRLPVEGFGGAVSGIISMNDIVFAARCQQASACHAEVVDTLQAIGRHHHPAPHVTAA